MGILTFSERLSLLHEPHMKPLTLFREKLLKTLPLEAFVPNFDPVDAGVKANVLLLLETPSRVPRETLFTSLDNPSVTSKNLRALVEEAGLERSKLLMWNLVPWDIGLKTKTQRTTGAHHSIGTPALLELLTLLPNLHAIVFFGVNAQKAVPDVQACQRAITLIRSPHPSSQVLNIRPEMRAHILAALQQARTARGDS